MQIAHNGFHISTASSIGMRERQEDRILCHPPLFAVADGVGGHAHGDRAAQTGVDTLHQNIPARADVPIAAMRHALYVADDAVRALGKCRVTGTQEHKMSCYCRTPCTTVTALWFTCGRVIVGHAGDSRLYRFSGGEMGDPVLTQVSEDHVFDNALDQCLGSRRPVVPQVEELEPGEGWLLCTDGLNDALTDAEILDLLMESPPGSDIAGILVSRAIAKGRSRQDNATAIWVEPRSV